MKEQFKDINIGSDDTEFIFVFLTMIGLACFAIGIVNLVAPQWETAPFPLYGCIISIVLGSILTIFGGSLLWVYLDMQEQGNTNIKER
jgi:hypothetical protein